MPPVQIPEGYKKCRVGILYSESEKHSVESRNFALWLCGSLVNTGYVSVKLIAYNQEKVFEVPPNRRIRFIPYGQTKPQEATMADYSWEQLSAISDCEVVVLAVNCIDCESLAKRLKSYELATRKNIDVTIFSFIRGVRSGAALRDEFTGMKHVAFVDGAMGFAVVPITPTSDILTPTVKLPNIAMERMSKEIADIATNPVSLIEVIGWPIQFRKVLTPMTWGVVAYECIYALNTVVGGTIKDTAMNSVTRGIYGAMIRESREALLSAARGGKWRADLTLIGGYVSNLWMLEMLLAFPNPIFAFLVWLTGFSLMDVPSPGSVDLISGRKTMSLIYLDELISAGGRNDTSMFVCQCVSTKIQDIETNEGQGSNLLLQSLLSEIKENDPSCLSLSTKELIKWILYIAAGISTLVFLWFIFIHEH